jgi:hypothetical protein
MLLIQNSTEAIQDLVIDPIPTSATAEQTSRFPVLNDFDHGISLLTLFSSPPGLGKSCGVDLGR